MKVSRKIGRRKHSHSSSISRRRLRSKKSYKKNSYRKKNAKTQKGGKRGRGYKRMRAHTHKRGKRFHRGGMFGKDDKHEGERCVFALPPLPNNIELKEIAPGDDIQFTIDPIKGVKLDYKRIDGIYGLKELEGTFDVELFWSKGVQSGRNFPSIKLTRYDAGIPTKEINISLGIFGVLNDEERFDVNSTDTRPLFNNMRATKPNIATPEGNYTFPATPKNKLAFATIYKSYTDAKAAAAKAAAEANAAAEAKTANESYGPLGKPNELNKEDGHSDNNPTLPKRMRALVAPSASTA